MRRSGVRRSGVRHSGVRHSERAWPRYRRRARARRWNRRSGTPRWFALACVLAGSACARAASTGVPPAAARPLAAQERVYVTAQDDAAVAVVDASTGELLESVDLTGMGFSPNARPHHVAVEPDGSHWYVSLIGDGKILKLDRQNRLVGQADFETPGMLALDPAGELLYVGRSMAAVSPPRRLGVIEREKMTLEEIDVFVPRPHALAVDARGRRVFTASLAENRLAWAPVGTEAVDILAIDGPMHMVVQLAVSPDGRWLVGGGQMTGDLLVWDLSGAAPMPAAKVHVGGQPWHPVFTPEGDEVWIPNLTEGTVTVVDTGTWAVAAVVSHPALAEPHGSAVTADGRTVFVSGRNTGRTYGRAPGGTLVAIDAQTREVRSITPVGRYAAGVAVATPWIGGGP